MRSTWLGIGAAAAIVLAATWAAQAGDSKPSTYTGCLAQGDEAKEFKLTHVNGGSDEYELTGGKGLNDHVGHKVEITGEVSSKSAEKAEGEKKSAAESTHEHLHVVSMKHVAATCP